MNDILCGSSCVKYILKKFKKNDENLNKKMKWITELAISLKEKNINNVEILCYKSNLYYDYINNKSIDFDFKGFYFIKKSLDLGIPITVLKLNKKELLREIKESKFIILCVESSVFNHNNMNGGHFIILNGISNNKIKVINPIKDKYEYRNENISDIIKYCKNYGSWRILIKEDIYDQSNCL